MKSTLFCSAAIAAAVFISGCNTNGLNVSVSTGGKVTSDDGTINCPSVCSRETTGSEVIHLSAVPEPGFEFKGWGGACTGTDSECDVSVDTASGATVSATFSRIIETVDQIPFTDDRFRACVLSAVDAQALPSQVVELNCSGTPVTGPITSLAGIEYLQNLNILRIDGGNQVADLKPLAKLPHFSVLSLLGESEKLVHVKPLLGLESFTELFLKSAPLLDCSEFNEIKAKLGDNYAILASGACN